MSFDTPAEFPIGPSAAPTPHPRGFGSDNWAGAHPEVIEAVVAANVGHAPGYGEDPWTTRFETVAREHFGDAAEAFPVFNGTGANVLALQAALPRWGAVVCASTAHVNYDETGAPEKVGGLKMLGVDTPNGKLTPELVDEKAWGWGSQHFAQPLAVSISQTTEWGTCYTPEEIRALADHAHARGMILHVDGSRLGNAAAHLGTGLGEITTGSGADLLTLGGTKNGLLGAEAVVVLGEGTAPGLTYLRKMNLQLASKMRFISAQLISLYEGDLWRRSASHANAMALRLEAGLEALLETGDAPGLEILQAVESNAVFAQLPPSVAAHARQHYAFGDWPSGEHTVRFMCAFDTMPEDVDALIAALTAGFAESA